MTAKDIIETEIPALLASKPDIAKQINAIVHFNITGDTGGTWTLDCTKTEGWVSSGASGTPKMTVTVSADDFVKLKTKQLNAMAAVPAGKLKFTPQDLGFAMKLAKLIT